MKISSDYSDLLRLFDDCGVRYLIVGSYAVMKYTEPMWSKDIDLWVDPTAENAQRVLNALQSFGAPTGALSVADLTNPTTVFQIGVEGNRIDIMVGVPGLDFQVAWNRRDTFLLNSGGNPVLSIEDTLAAAKAANRPKDRVRIRALKKAIQIRKKIASRREPRT